MLRTTTPSFGSGAVIPDETQSQINALATALGVNLSGDAEQGATLEDVIEALRDGATITVDAAVDTNTFKLGSEVYAFGAAGIGAAVVAGTAGVKNQANAVLIATALAAHDDVETAVAAAGVVTVTSKINRCFVFSGVTATRLVVAYTSPAGGNAAQHRSVLEAIAALS